MGLWLDSQEASGSISAAASHVVVRSSFSRVIMSVSIIHGPLDQPENLDISRNWAARVAVPALIHGDYHLSIVWPSPSGLPLPGRKFDLAVRLGSPCRWATVMMTMVQGLRLLS